MVGGALAWWTFSSTDDKSEIDSLAVLPFEDFSAAREVDYLADGIHDALITELSKISALRVLSRNSVNRYRETKKSAYQIAHELGVDALVEGSVTRSDDAVRITVQLIDAESEQHLCASSFERQIENILALQGDVARAIADEIRVTLEPEELSMLSASTPVRPKAHEAYLKASHYWHRSEDIERSAELLEEAVAEDPSYALAWGRLAEIYVLLNMKHLREAKEVLPRAKRAALKALALDDRTVEAHTALAEVYCHFENDWAAARRQLEKAVRLSPSFARAWWRNSGHLVAQGRKEEGIAATRRAQELDPPGHDGAGHNLYLVHDYEAALMELRQALSIDPDSVSSRIWLAKSLIRQGKMREGVLELEEACNPQNSEACLNLAWAYAVDGQVDKAESLLQEMLNRDEYLSFVSIAQVYTALGREDQVLRQLERALESGDATLIWIEAEPAFEALHGRPRFQKLVRAIGLEGLETHGS